MFKSLEVDLSRWKIHEKNLSEEFRKFLGGRGVAVKLMIELVEPKVEPLSPENKLIFSTGALINSRIPMSGRSNTTSISPLTNTIFSSNVGGMLGHCLSSTGYDVLVIHGQATEPLYLTIGEKSSLHPARDVWSKDVFETTDYLVEKHGVAEENIACIGLAGEHQNYFGNIMVQKHRAFGRGGLGAVMGYKKLKAIVFQGNKERQEPRFKDLSKRLREKIANINTKLKTQGTSGVVNTANKNGAFPTRYFITNEFEFADKINGDVLESHKVKNGTCYSCPVACKMITKSERYGIVTDGPEYETIVFQGSNLGISDFEAIIKSNDLCDRYGLDTISSGNIMGAFIEACQKGKIDHSISWGEGEKVHELIERIAKNKEIGQELQHGTNAFCKKYGIEAVTVKGLDVPGHDPRALHGMALGYATSNRGADHLYSTTYKDEYNHPQRQEIAGKAKLLIGNENRNAVLDSLGLCKFSTSFYRDDDYLEIMAALLEREVNIKEFQSIGSKIVDMERSLNNKRGFDSSDDVLPDRVRVPNLEAELQEYYKLRDWTTDGKVNLRK
ncbi:MAG: aldehyde ferredoxin oxidoreductase family protein [Thermoplasmata archaeon]